MITLTHLGMRFGDHQVIRDFNAQLQPGRLTALVGPSGCGKSTLLRLIAGLLQPTQGSVETGCGRPAFVFQDPQLLQWRSALENVRLPLEILGVPRPQADEKASTMLRQTGLGEAASLRPHQLSGGMRMRVSLARALVTEPDLLLLDEPFAALDEIVRERLGESVADLVRGTGMSTIFVTHSLQEACFLADRVLLLGPEGSIAADETLDFGPRNPALRDSPDFMSVVRRLHSALRKVAP